MRILGIETSCDETGVAIYDEAHGIIFDALHSQLNTHAQYGGVVPELASRDHIRMTLPLIRRAMEQTETTADMLDGIAYTAGPGLIGALLVGVAIGHGLSLAWGLPAIPVHHMEAHLLAPMLEQEKPEYPFLALLISGGHTLLVTAERYRHYTILGESVDDAAGEAFDKVAKLLGLPYPGGRATAVLAEKGDPNRFHFPRPMTNSPGLNFSFSGLKTHTLDTLHKADDLEQTRADIARAFVDAVVDTLTIKCKRAIKKTGLKRVVVAGGVSANRQLRARLQQLAKEDDLDIYFPRPQFCTDNGAMIAYTGYLQRKTGDTAEQILEARPRWPLSELVA